MKAWKILILVGMAFYAWYFKGKLPPVTFERSYFTVGFVLTLYVLVKLFEDQQRYKEPQFVAPNLHFSQITYPIKAGIFTIIEGDMIKLNPFMNPKRVAILPEVLLEHTERNMQTKVIFWKITQLKQLPLEAYDKISSDWMRYKDCEFYYGQHTIEEEQLLAQKANKLFTDRAKNKVDADFRQMVTDEDSLMEAKASSVRRIGDAFQKESLVSKLKSFWRSDKPDETKPPQ